MSRLRDGRARFAAIALVALFMLGVLACPVYGQDLSGQLSDAEAVVASAEAEVVEAEADVDPARAGYAAALRRAAPAKRAARSAARKAKVLRAAKVGRQQNAAAQVSRLEADHQNEVDEHDEQVSTGIGLAIAALVIGAIALGWEWFRASPPVAWLSKQSRAQAIGLSVFGGFALIVVGAALTGAVEAIGLALAVLGFALTVALLLAYYSAEVQGGKAKPLLKRERLPTWVTRAVAVVMLLLVLGGIGSAISAEGAGPAVVSAQLQQVAGGEVTAENRQLAAAEAKAAVLRTRASRLSAAESSARRAFARARHGLTRAEGRLIGTEGDVHRYTRQLAAITARETREAEEQEKIEAEEFEEAEEEELEGGSGGCDPNYVGACLDPTSYDYDCAGGSGDGPDYTGPVQVVGSDPYGLDADGDGYACEE